MDKEGKSINDKEKKPNNKTEKDYNNSQKNSDSDYLYAKWMLSEIKEQYAVENERENRISTKASTFITVIVAIIALYIPLVPFDKLVDFFEMESYSLSGKVMAIIMLVFLGVGLITLMFSFIYFLRAYKVKGYNRVSVDNLYNIACETRNKTDKTESRIAQGITEHYHKILRGDSDTDGNMKINTYSAQNVKIGIILTVIGFAIISIATITLRIVVVL